MRIDFVQDEEELQGRIIYIGFASMFTVVTKEYLIYNFGNIIAAVGGNVGLFLGKPKLKSRTGEYSTSRPKRILPSAAGFSLFSAASYAIRRAFKSEASRDPKVTFRQVTPAQEANMKSPA